MLFYPTCTNAWCTVYLVYHNYNQHYLIWPGSHFLLSMVTMVSSHVGESKDASGHAGRHGEEAPAEG